MYDFTVTRQPKTPTIELGNPNSRTRGEIITIDVKEPIQCSPTMADGLKIEQLPVGKYQFMVCAHSFDENLPEHKHLKGLNRWVYLNSL